MRLFRWPTAFLVILSLAGCASAPPKAEPSAVPPAAEGSVAKTEEPAGASDPGNLEVVDPVAPRKGDHFPNAAISASPPSDRPGALAPGFLIRLAHQEDRDLNGTFRINFDGKIDLPYNISFRAEGLTMEEFRAKVLESYRPFYKTGLRLSVDLVEKAYFVEMRGLIAKPGKYKVKSDTSLDEVISMGGGFPTSPENQPRFLKITRGEQERMVNLEDYYKSGSLKANSAWRGGEILFFQKESVYTEFGTAANASSAIQVLGEVKRPGEFAHRSGVDVFFYMAEAGGPTRDTDFFKVQIYRGPPGKRTMTEFELEEPEKVPAILPGDILVFQADKPTRFQKNVTTAANIASIITAIALVIIAL